MDTKDTAETTAPSVAPVKRAPKPKLAGGLHPEDPTSSVPLSEPKDDSLDLSDLGAAFSELRVGSPECKEKEKEKETGKGGARKDCEGEHERSIDAPSGNKPSESTPGATEHPATSSPTATTLLATHPAISSPTTTPPMARGTL